jgi:branched-chain amino acid transport system substrate-binding protein
MIMKATISWSLVIAALVITALLVSGCTQQPGPQNAGQELRIGVVASITGSASTTGKDIWQCAQLAADEINAQGGLSVPGISGKVPVKVILGDDESSREGGMKAVSRLITQDNVNILVGGFSSAVVSAHQSLAADNGVPYIITGASTPVVTHRTDIDTRMMFHYCPTTDDYGEQTIKFADEVIRPAVNSRFNYSANRPLRIALLVQDSPYGKGVQQAVNNTVASGAVNAKIVAIETFKMGETDFRTALTAIKAAQPDVVYPAAFLNEQIPIVTQARREVGLNSIFLAVECNDDPDYYTGVGHYGEYSVMESRFSPYAVPKGPLASAVISFRNRFNQRFGSYPGMMGASTYEGIFIAGQAAAQAGSLDRARIRDVLTVLTMPEIVEAMKGGVIRFTPDYREAKFDLYMEQLVWNQTAGEPRPRIVWPDTLKEADFVLPDWYVPGPAS